MRLCRGPPVGALERRPQGAWPTGWLHDVPRCMGAAGCRRVSIIPAPRRAGTCRYREAGARRGWWPGFACLRRGPCRRGRALGKVTTRASTSTAIAGAFLLAGRAAVQGASEGWACVLRQTKDAQVRGPLLAQCQGALPGHGALERPPRAPPSARRGGVRTGAGGLCSVLHPVIPAAIPPSRLTYMHLSRPSGHEASLARRGPRPDRRPDLCTDPVRRAAETPPTAALRQRHWR